MRLVLTATVAIALSLSPSRPLHAWEADVHYVLTYWLAVQAGFSIPNADRIAQGNQGEDDSYHASAIGSVLWMIISGDVGAARGARDKHFPSDAELPSPPGRRAVKKNSSAARSAADAFVRSATVDSDLNRLGQALHPLQDSWSHQGVPDIPYGLRSGLAVGHPKARGGWGKHDSDYTHLHVKDLEDAARETYGFFTRFLDANPSFRVRKSEEWTSLVRAIREFANAREKEEWATKHINPDDPNSPEDPEDPVNPEAVKAATGRGRGREFNSPTWSPIRISPVNESQRDVAGPEMAPDADRETTPDAVVEKALSILGMLERAELDTIVASGMNLSELATQVPHLAADRTRLIEWSKRMLTVGLLVDHELVNRLGHGEFGSSARAKTPSLEDIEDGSLATFADVDVDDEDFTPVRISDRPFYVLRMESNFSRDLFVLVWDADGLLARIVLLPQ